MTSVQAEQKRFTPTVFARRGIVLSAACAAIARLAVDIGAATGGDLAPLTAYGFTVLFPLVLIGLLLSLGPGRTWEGVLMRLGTAWQFILIVAVPPYALHLLLGLPLIFLLVELFETRLPRRVREPVTAWFVEC